jgi:hypothetical protein
LIYGGFEGGEGGGGKGEGEVKGALILYIRAQERRDVLAHGKRYRNKRGKEKKPIVMPRARIRPDQTG